MYSVAWATVSIPGGVQRLQKQGYCQNILMQDVWKLTVAQNSDDIQQDQGTDAIPVVFVTRIIDEVGT